MASEITTRFTAGQNLYAVIWFGGTVWNGTAFEAPVAANWGTYDIPLTETAIAGAQSRYAADFPTAIVDSGVFGVEIYQRAGASPAVGDTLFGVENFVWSAGHDLGDSVAIIGATTGGDSLNAGSTIESFKDFKGNLKVTVPVDNSGNRTGVSYS